MCGLCGIAGNIGNQDIQMFKWLLFLSQMRGEDATGVIRIGKGDDKKLRKNPETYHYPFNHVRQAAPASYFLSEDETGIKEKHLWNHKDTIAFLGHARYGTKGDKNITSNAHPFNFPNVIGMQNGTIHKQFKYSKDFPTDTEALYKNIDENGIEAALNEVEAFDSAWALTYFNKRDNTINFIRNDKRPLWMTLANNKTVVAWASEDWMLRAVVNRLWPNEKLEIFQPKADILLSYPLDRPNFWLNPDSKTLNIKRNVWTNNNFKSKPSISMYWDGNEYSDWQDQVLEHDNEKHLGTSRPINPGTALVNATGEKSFREAGKRHFFKAPGGGDIPRLKFNRLLDNGCGVCGNPGDVDDPIIDSKIGWLTNDNWICESCQDDPWVTENMCFTKVNFRVASSDTTKLVKNNPQVG